MLHINKEVNLVLNEVIEELCKVNSNNKIKLTSECDQYTENTKLCDLSNNQAESPQEKLLKFNICSQKTSEILVNDSEERKKKFPDEFFNNTYKYPLECASMPLFLSENKVYYKSHDDSLDEAIDEAFIKYETFEKNSVELKDVSVQTIYQIEMTADKQCQCDIYVDNSLDAYQPSKRIKLNDYYYYLSFGNTHWKSGQPEVQQTDIKAEYIGSDKEASQIKASRIRIGLSKRAKTSPLHILN